MSRDEALEQAAPDPLGRRCGCQRHPVGRDPGRLGHPRLDPRLGRRIQNATVEPVPGLPDPLGRRWARAHRRGAVWLVYRDDEREVIQLSRSGWKARVNSAPASLCWSPLPAWGGLE